MYFPSPSKQLPGHISNKPWPFSFTLFSLFTTHPNLPCYIVWATARIINQMKSKYTTVLHNNHKTDSFFQVDTMISCWRIPMLWRKVMIPSSWMKFNPVNRTIFLQNVGTHLQDYMASQPRRSQPEQSPLRKPEKTYIWKHLCGFKAVTNKHKRIWRMISQICIIKHCFGLSINKQT
jgi:hypothetical protein